jgi:hypothetical protein
MSINAIRSGDSKKAIELLEYESELEEVSIAAVEEGFVRVIRAILALSPWVAGSHELLEAILGQTDELARDLLLSAPRPLGSWPITVQVDDVSTYVDMISLLRCYSPYGWYCFGFTVPDLIEYALEMDHGDLMHLAQPEDLPRLLRRARKNSAIECVDVLTELI